MKIAITYEQGNVFQHFGHTKQFKLYNVEDNRIIDTVMLETGNSGHGALTNLLSMAGVDVLICGGIGGGAKAALAEKGIKLYGGVQGSATAAVVAFLAGQLEFNPDVHCDHHDHEHGEGHTCGYHSCGNCSGH